MVQKCNGSEPLVICSENGQKSIWAWNCGEKAIGFGRERLVEKQCRDDKNRFDTILDDYLEHITDEKPLTARQCIKALVQVGIAKTQYIPRILSCFHSADLSKDKDSMRPLLEKDIEETERLLTEYISTLQRMERNRGFEFHGGFYE